VAAISTQGGFLTVSPPGEEATARKQQPGNPAPAMGPGTALAAWETCGMDV